jgi:hypothetical protein
MDNRGTGLCSGMARRQLARSVWRGWEYPVARRDWTVGVSCGALGSLHYATSDGCETTFARVESILPRGRITVS